MASEIGENDCSGSYLGPLLSWLDSKNTSYLAWAWDDFNCSGGPSLISNYNGTATAFGAAFKAHVAALPAASGTGGSSTTSTPAEIHAEGAAKCLDVPHSSQAEGTQVQIWPCNSGANQQWTLNASGTITGVQSGLCLDVTGASTADGALAELWTCNGGSNQKWTRS